MSTEQNKLLVRRLFERLAANKDDLSAFDEVFAPSIRVTFSGAERAMDRESLKQLRQAINTAWPDRQDNLDDLIGQGDKVVVRWTTTGTHTGDLIGPTIGRIPATGKPTRMTGIDIFRLADGKIVEYWNETDRLGMLQQLGLLPTPEPASA